MNSSSIDKIFEGSSLITLYYGVNNMSDPHIFVGQSALRIFLNTGIDLTTASGVTIKYKQPDETISGWTASIYNAVKGTIYYDVNDTDINQAGEWSLWTHVIFNNGTIAMGRPELFNVYEEGSICL